MQDLVIDLLHISELLLGRNLAGIPLNTRKDCINVIVARLHVHPKNCRSLILATCILNDCIILATNNHKLNL